ncbi:MAG: glycoside hydrolase family 3 C-terminal domain-containing protein [Tannerellaceae bacterium]|jgi:beta-glucosidase|nr:glycoside hydrolase family 3 C-terminal domain-containing protein [Tannerellaceae bacterium]
MKTTGIFMSFVLCLLQACTQGVPQLGKAPVDKVLGAMTPEEKASLLVGVGMPGFGGNSAVVGETQSLVPGAAGTTTPIPRLGIPAIVVADGPAGLRISPRREGDSATYYCTAFPVGTLLASTWNTELVERVGEAMGNEVLEYGVDILLGPGLNIHRNPLCGRNFEYYSEDPLVAGKTGAAIVKGIQSNGVGTSVKHFAVNNQETNRMGNDARLTARALREIYLKAFETVVRESAPWTLMSSYNYVNGVYASESRDLLTTILREEWGFRGIVMTDWFGGKNVPAQVYAGNDLLMPGRPDQTQAILDAIAGGSLNISDVDTNVKRILELILATPRFKGYAYSNKPDLQAHAGITRRSAAEGMVLLKNNAGTLPLDEAIRKIAAFGTTSYDFIAGGTGSGDVNEAYTVSLSDGLQNAGYTLDTDLTALYEAYKAAEEAKRPKSDNPFMNFFSQARIPEFLPEHALTERKAKEADAAIITIGRNSGEFTDRKIEGDFDLTSEEKALIRQVTGAFHKEGKKAVVILNIGGVIETASWKDVPDAILLAWQGGQEGGNSVADILKGEVNPSGKLPMTFPVHYMDHASSANFPYDYKIDPQQMMASMSSAIGAAGAAGEAPQPKEQVKNVGYTGYEEDIYIGYRYFDTFGKEVSYPFGYGLSYTTFEYAATQDAGNPYTLNVTVKNTGSRAGKEVVQLYVSAPAGDSDRPEKELKAFAKTRMLQPGESETLSLTLTVDDLASFSERENAWVTSEGTYRLRLGASSRDVRSEFVLENIQHRIVASVHDVMKTAAPVTTIIKK